MKKYRVLGLVVFFLSLLGSSCGPGPTVEEKISFKGHVIVFPEFRCEGDDVTFQWSLSNDGKLFVNALVPWNGQVRSGEIFFSPNDNGSATIDLKEIEGKFSRGENNGYNFGEGFQFPSDFTLEFVPKNNAETVTGEKQTKTVHTIIGNERVSREAGRRPNENLFIVDLPSPTWSDNLKVDEINLLSGCTDPISGSYEYDKGLETLNPVTLTIANNYTDRFSSAVKAQGIWAIKPLDQECDKGVTTLRVEFEMFCDTPR
jgi:hypothetical protein